jgi:Raf kinase inhibitor-like YbhB/YbcL family protein
MNLIPKPCLAGAALAFLIFIPQMASAQVAARPPVLAQTILQTPGAGKLIVTSSGFENGGMLPRSYTQFGADRSPPLSWSHGPNDTRSYAVIVEDAGVDRPRPRAQWVIYNIPADRAPGNVSLDADVATTPTPKVGTNGINGHGHYGYVGPKTPRGETHPYHFQVFALDTVLLVAPAKATRDVIVAAMKGHVVASGDLVGKYTGTEDTGMPPHTEAGQQSHR